MTDIGQFLVSYAVDYDNPKESVLMTFDENEKRIVKCIFGRKVIKLLETLLKDDD